jgi:RNA polymerase-binding transcription factor DksA
MKKVTTVCYQCDKKIPPERLYRFRTGIFLCYACLLVHLGKTRGGKPR